MADAPAKTLYTVKNTQAGPRGIWSDGVLTYIDPATLDEDGKPIDGTGSVLAELTDDDKALADKSGFFEIRKETADDQAGDGDGPDLSILDSSVADMKTSLDALDLDHLKALRDAEVAGKNRASALAAIDEAIAAKSA